MKTKIYVIRHAEAEGNLFRRCHGQFESAVTPNGLRQVEALSRRFAGERIDACYSSDLIRTRVTARALCDPRGLTLRTDPRFREVNLGVWEDVPFGQLEWEQRDVIARFSTDPYHWHVDKAEDFEVYSGRFVEALRETAARHAGETIAVFAHGSVIRGMQLRLFYNMETIGQIGHCDNTGVSLLTFEDGVFEKVYLNDNSHLPEEISTLARQNWWRGGARRDYDLWFRPMARDEAWYIECRRDAWENVYGPAPRFDGAAFYRAALQDAAGAETALWDVMLDGRRVGLLQLAPSRYAAEGVGYIPFLYLIPSFRGLGLGIQVIGQAVSVYRRLGRDRLRLSVSPQNRAAMAFYRKYGFRETGRTSGEHGELLRMDLDIPLTRGLEVPAAAR